MTSPQYIAARTPFTMSRQIHMSLRAFRRIYHYWATDNLNGVSQSMALPETRLPRLVKLSMMTLSAATFLFLVWAALTTVKEIARTEGQVLPSGYNQLVQHLEGGLVKAILVHEGDFVQKDQLLAQLNGAGLEEDFLEQQALVQSLWLQSEVLHAVLENRKPDFSQITTSPEVVAQQQHIYESMRASRTSDRGVITEQIAQKKTSIARISQELATARSNLNISQQSQNIYLNLENKGLVAHTTALSKEGEVNSKQGEVNALAQQLQQSRQELAEFERRQESLIAGQSDSAYSDLHKVDADLAQAAENLKKRNNRVSRLDVRAPVAGYVKGMKLNTIGAVIPAGQTLMEIVPVDEQLIVEARILPQQVGRVAVGQEVQVKVDSYDYVRYGTIPGKLESISAMTFSDEIRRQDYYKGRIRLEKNYAGNLPGAHRVMPGMTVDADIVTGEKSILGYLLKPIQVAVHNAMTEQ